MLRMQSIARSCLAAFTCLAVASVGAVSTTGCSAAADRDGGGPVPDAAGSDADPAFEVSVLDARNESSVCANVVDVVFVLDVSSSMDFVLDTLDAQIDQVVTASNALAPDAHFGLIPFVDNYAIDATGPLEAGKVHTAAPTLKAAFQYDKKTYTTPNRNPGDGPSGPQTQNPICEENALDALHAAATEFPWRPNATRVVILVTDDTFLERPDNYGDRDGDGLTNKTDYPKEGNYPAKWTVPETVAALKSSQVRVFSFTRLKAPGALDLGKCGTGRRLAWSAVSDGWTTPYKTNAPIPTQTAGKNFDLDQVKGGKLSLTATIKQVVVDSYCNPPIY